MVQLLCTNGAAGPTTDEGTLPAWPDGPVSGTWIGQLCPICAANKEVFSGLAEMGSVRHEV